MSRKSRRRRKQPTGVLSWFRSQQNITKVVYLFVAFIFVGGVFVSFGGSRSGGCSPGFGGNLTAEEKARLAEVIATVGGTEITREVFEDEWMNVSASADKQAEETGIYVPPPEEYYLHRYLVLDGLMMRKLIELESAKRGIVVEGSEVDELMEQFKSENLRLGVVTDEKRSLFQRFGDWLAKAKEDKNFRAALMEKYKITPEYLEQFYMQRLLGQKFDQNFNAEVRRSLEDDAKLKTDAILARLDEGEEFEDLVSEYSDDMATKEIGGLVEDVKRNSNEPPEIIDNAFEYAVGEVSPAFRVHMEMANPFGQGPPMVFDSFAIIQVTDKRVATGEEFEAELDTTRELIRQEKFEAEVQDNPEITLEDIDVSDEEITEEYEKVSYRIIKIDFFNYSLSNERAQEIQDSLRESYNMTVLDPSFLAWEKAKQGDYEGAREEWALHMADPRYAMDNPRIAKIKDDLEREDTIDNLMDAVATLNYVNGLFYKIQIDGYGSMKFRFQIPGEKQTRRSERAEAFAKDPETNAVNPELSPEDPEAIAAEPPDPAELTEEEIAEYARLNEEALPSFELAIERLDIDPYAQLLLGETLVDLERFEDSVEHFTIAAEYASEDLNINSRIRVGLAKVVESFGEEEIDQGIIDVMDSVDAKVMKIQQQMQAAQQGGMNFG